MQLHLGNCLDILPALPAQSIQCCVTSPPYYSLRDYGVAGQYGLEATPEDYVAKLVAVCREVRRVLRDDGTLWLNLGDSYCGGGGFSAGAPSTATSKTGRYGHRGALKSGGVKPCGSIKPKDLLGMPWRVAFALQADGWYLRSAIILHKANVMPESVTDRPTTCYEHVFLLTKQERYFYDGDAIREPYAASSHSRYAYTILGVDADRRKPGAHNRISKPRKGMNPLGRNSRNVWQLSGAKLYSGKQATHFAQMPIALAERCILAGSRLGDTILDPFGGIGTTGAAALSLGRDAVLIELNPDYHAVCVRRLSADVPAA